MEPHSRKHGPRGYRDYRNYKPWLRDEFLFRCVYCLTRERWCPNGREAFSVEHINPKATTDNYDELAYACCSCNRNRKSSALPLDPVAEPLGSHLTIAADGAVVGLTREGDFLIRVCHLNRPLLVEFRRRLIFLLTEAVECEDDRLSGLLPDLLGFPADLPDLRTKRPPEGNERPNGVVDSWLERREREELPDFY